MGHTNSLEPVRVLFCFALLAGIPGTSLHADVTPSEDRVPKEMFAPASDLVPIGWLADYDYVGDLKSYLKTKSDAASEDGKSVYAYFFTDEYKHCREVRKLMNKQRFQKAQADVVMVMLNYDYFRKSFLEYPERLFNFGNRHPLILKVTAEGNLTQPVLFPGIYIFHRSRIPEKSLRRQVKKNLKNPHISERVLAKRMRAYFAE